jgi:hypothetical protein
MRCQYFVSTRDIQCENEATRRMVVGCPPGDRPVKSARAYMVQVCNEHDPDPRVSMLLPKPSTSVPIGQRPRR